jgi:3-oxoacyl-[acyl-carrier protein] reductase
MLTGKIAVVTGSSGGIGSAIVESFARSGAFVWAHSRRPDLQNSAKWKTYESLYNVKIVEVFCDLCSPDERKAVQRQIMESEFQPDVIVNNAGVSHGGLFQMTKIDKIRDVFESNFFAQIEFTQHFLRSLSRKSSGSIINIASIAGIDLSSGNMAYGVSKACIIAATRTLAAELGGLGIRVNAVAPGLIDTKMADLMEPKAREMMIQQSAMRRLGRPDEIASVVTFLASDMASFINGQIIRVDGGGR